MTNKEALEILKKANECGNRNCTPFSCKPFQQGGCAKCEYFVTWTQYEEASNVGLKALERLELMKNDQQRSL